MTLLKRSARMLAGWLCIALGLAVIALLGLGVLEPGGHAAMTPALVSLLTAGGRLLALVKPQFEVGREHVGKHGVVRDDALRAEALRAVVTSAEALGLALLGQADCRIEGPRGNREIFALFVRRG